MEANTVGMILEEHVRNVCAVLCLLVGVDLASSLCFLPFPCSWGSPLLWARKPQDQEEQVVEIL